MFQKWLNKIRLKGLPDKTDPNVLVVDSKGDIGINTSLVGDITTVTAGDALTGGGSTGDITINHEDTSTQASVNNSGNTYIQDITLDTYGHITGITSAAIASTIVDAEEIRELTGTLEDSTHLGTFDGSTIADSRSIKDALQDLETKLETDASTSAKGVASFNSDQFVVSSGAVELNQTQVKVLPHHFMSNEDGGANKSAQFRDDTIIGVRATHNDAELYAFVEIPSGKTATNVTVYGNDTGLAVNVYESDINAGALTDKTPGGGCTVGSACDITDVAADATNYLVIKVTITQYTNDIVYGATVTLT